MHLFRFRLFILAIALLASCKSPEPPDINPDPKPVDSLELRTAHQIQTYPQTNGNRVLEGKGNIVGKAPLKIQLGKTPAWLLGAPYENGSLWVCIMDDGIINAFTIDSMGKDLPLEWSVTDIPAGMPPALIFDKNGHAQLLNELLPADASTVSAPLLMSEGYWTYISDQGELVRGNERLDVNALPDARLIKDENDQLLIFSGPSDHYRHAVLGDAFEATGISVVKTIPNLRLLNTISFPGDAVAEGIAPIWMDLNGDNNKEILITLSNNPDGGGARLVLYNEQGDLLARGPLSPGGWRHQLAVVEISGNSYILDVQKPHVDRKVNLYEWVGDSLIIRSSLSGFSTHQIGSRNLDMALLADMDGNGQQELIVPNTAYDQLHGLDIKGDQLSDVWEQGLNARLLTNIAAVSFPDGSLAMGVGTANQELLIWLP